MAAADVIESLRQHHSPANGWVSAAEVSVATGFMAAPHMPPELLGCGAQRIDFFAMHTYPSKGFERVAYEVKVSRGDLLRELKDETKSLPCRVLADRFCLAVPVGLVKRKELPDGWGLVEIRADGTARTTVRGEVRDPGPLPMPFAAAFLRAASDQRPTDRCGAVACHRPGRNWRSTGRNVWQGVRLALCDRHADEWDQEVQVRVAVSAADGGDHR